MTDASIEPDDFDWDREPFLRIGEAFGIADLEALRREVTKAYHFATFGLFSATYGDLSSVPPQLRAFARSETTQRLLRLSRLQAALVMELAAQTDDPLLQSESAAALRKALGRFGADLLRATSNPMVTDKSQRKPQTRLAMALAPAWERLTGEKPTAFRVGENTEEGAGKFYRFVCAVCDLYEIDYPSVDAAREAYAPRVRRKSPST